MPFSIRNIILFLIPAVIWGSTWYVITFQLGVVNPLVSIIYRFSLAGFILLIYCLIARISLKFSLKQHFFISLMGLFMFGLNYWLVYTAETFIKSGLVAVIMSLIIFHNIIFNYLFLKGKIRSVVVYAGCLGVIGTALIYFSDLEAFSVTQKTFMALGSALGASVLASLGNIISARLQHENVKVVPANALGMLYGAVGLAFIALILEVPFRFDFSQQYIFSLLYLVLLGSIVAFTAYLRLLGNIGPDRSAYVVLVIPVLAMIVSTLFEHYVWSLYSLAGIAFVLTGNYFALRRK